MPNLDGMQIKEKIISLLRIKGPSLPVHISGATGVSILFAGAFLSELISEKKVKISEMKVGSSPIYYLPGQESMLDRYSQHLKSKERDAYELLKSRKFLHDKSQEPAIRVALRAIKDFAIPFEKNSDLYWRHHTMSESEFIIEKTPIIKETEKPPIIVTQAITNTEIPSKTEERRTLTFNTQSEEKPLNIFEKKERKEKEHKKPNPKTKKPVKKTSKKEEGFFNKVKELLNKKGIEIIDIEDIKNGEIILKISNKGQEELLIAYSKKKISDNDILKANKKAQEAGLPYMILSLGEAPKKTKNLLEAARNLRGIEKL